MVESAFHGAVWHMEWVSARGLACLWVRVAQGLGSFHGSVLCIGERGRQTVWGLYRYERGPCDSCCVRALRRSGIDCHNLLHCRMARLPNQEKALHSAPRNSGSVRAQPGPSATVLLLQRHARMSIQHYNCFHNHAAHSISRSGPREGTRFLAFLASQCELVTSHRSQQSHLFPWLPCLVSCVSRGEPTLGAAAACHASWAVAREWFQPVTCTYGRRNSQIFPG